MTLPGVGGMSTVLSRVGEWAVALLRLARTAIGAASLLLIAVGTTLILATDSWGFWACGLIVASIGWWLFTEAIEETNG